MTCNVVVFQYRLLHYRLKLFERLRAVCAERGINFILIHGQASRREATKNDEGYLPWAHRVKNRFIEIGERDLVWQPFPAKFKDVGLVIVMQENRILSNYPLLLGRLWSRRKVAYWGHGKNFQSDVPHGLREQWKNFLINRVDWWFAYTATTVQILREAGYPLDHITCLDNAIDTDGFKADLASCSAHEITLEKARFGIAADGIVGLFCGSLYPDKRLDLLIDASDLIRQRFPKFSLLVIGDGPSKPLLHEAAITRPWLHLLGAKKGREKALCYRVADISMNPGSVGLHVVDAFCSGAVMVTTRLARHGPEFAYLRDGENALLSDDNPHAYSQAVIALIQEPTQLQRMRANALADSERYTLENMVQRFTDGIAAAMHGSCNHSGRSPPSLNPRRAWSLLGVTVDEISGVKALDRVLAWSHARESRFVVLANVHVVVTASSDTALGAAVATADMVTPDGAPVAWMLGRLSHTTQERVTGPDLTWALLGRCEAESLPVYFFGSSQETLALLAARINHAFPALTVAGYEAPPFRPMTAQEDAEAVQRINLSGAGLVFVGLGCPKQEKWMHAHRGRIKAVMLGVGAAFDFHAGTVARAPTWMRNSGLEWLHRMLSEPRRLWKRYLVTNSIFMARAAWQLLRK